MAILWQNALGLKCAHRLLTPAHSNKVLFCPTLLANLARNEVE
jgi:hypothetical protein